jgi:hypothetical protein
MGPEVEQVEHAGTPASVDVWFFWKASFFFGGGRMLSPQFTTLQQLRYDIKGAPNQLCELVGVLGWH